MKRLILIPVIHNLADLGSLAESVRAHYLEHFGPAVWQQRQRAVAELWKEIRRAIEALHLDCGQVRIYQDGLPVCGKEEQIVHELAGAGSLNHQLVLELMGKGAVFMGTEDPQLLIREYQLHRRRMDAAGGNESVFAAAVVRRGGGASRGPRPLHCPTDCDNPPGRRNRFAVPGSGTPHRRASHARRRRDNAQRSSAHSECACALRRCSSISLTCTPLSSLRGGQRETQLSHIDPCETTNAFSGQKNTQVTLTCPTCDLSFLKCISRKQRQETLQRNNAARRMQWYTLPEEVNRQDVFLIHALG